MGRGNFDVKIREFWMRQSLVSFMAFVGPDKDLLVQLRVITHCRTADVYEKNIFATHSCLPLRGAPGLFHSLVDILYLGT